jgi:hypothetical protein
MNKKEIKNIFGWLEEITIHKTQPKLISESSWELWNTWLVHKYLSMNISYIDIVNYVQKINPQNKEQIYTIYKEFIPKQKVWLKYLKNENKKDSKELCEYISKYFECGLKEAQQYVEFLPKPELISILKNFALEDKEIKKLMK